MDRNEWRRTFAKTMRKMMANRNITQEKMCEMTGASKTSMNYYVLGKSEPAAYMVYRIADALDVSADALLGNWKV